MEEVKSVLGVVDYIIFALMLIVSAGIGVFFKFTGGKQKTAEEFLLAGKDMSLLPVAFSLMASFLSAITVIGIPAEMYKYGVHMAFINIGFSTGTILSAYLFLPVYFDIEASTVYEYVDKRFGKLARTLTSFAFVAQMILYMSVVLYAPALALSAVTNLSTWISVISIGVVCTFYCTLGGMKAVLWTDVFQAVLMYLCIFTILIKGCMDVGGMGEVFRIAGEGGRLVLPSLGEDFTSRYTMLNVILQGLILSMAAFGANQVQVQRLLTVKNITRSRIALFISIPMSACFHLCNCLAGVIIYSNFANCDPLTSEEKPITSADQLLPYYVMSSLKNFPGLPGLCICGIFSASLSTVSSAVNSLTAVTMQDLVRPFCLKRGMSQKATAFTAKGITFFYGFLCVVLTFLVATFGNLVQASLTVFGMLGGPVLGVFMLGMLTTRANEKGVITGLLSSIAIASWLSFGSSSKSPTLPTSTDGCTFYNSSNNYTYFENTSLAEDITVVNLPTAMTINSTLAPVLDNDVFILYKISYMWFTPISFACCVIIGYIASIVVNICLDEEKKVPLEYVSPLVRWLYKSHETYSEKKADISSSPALNSFDTKENGTITDSKSARNEAFEMDQEIKKTKM